MMCTGNTIMDSQSFYTRQMLLQYGKQLIAARRLARYESMIGRSKSSSDEAAQAKRRALVERIAREIIDNLIFSGSDNPIVRDVKENLARETGEHYIFRYPPAEEDFQIFRETPEGQEEELSADDKRNLMGQLWNVALRTVDATML